MAVSKQLLVNSTAEILIESYGENRRVLLHNSNDHSCYLGGPGVTSTTGLEFAKATSLEFVVPIKSVIYAATAGNNTTTVSVLFLAP
jgi:hypothetical protein